MPTARSRREPETASQGPQETLQSPPEAPAPDQAERQPDAPQDAPQEPEEAPSEALSPEEAAEAERQAQLEDDVLRSQIHVHAKYLGDTQVAMPDLKGRGRCCLEENQREDINEPGQLNPHTVLDHGDMILLDLYSAEGREDFEVVEDEVMQGGEL